MMPYDEQYFAKRSEISHEVLTEVDWVRRFLRGKTVLDVACGTGRHGYILEYYGYEVTYFDLSEHALKKIFWSNRKICGDFLEYDFGDVKFDNVISFHFIEHLTDKQLVRALEKMKKLTRYRIINVTPHPKSIVYDKDKTHVPRTFRRLVKIYLSVLPNTRIYSFDNKFRPHPLTWIKGIFEKLRPHYFEQVMFVTEVG